MQETLHDHHTSISTSRRPICSLRFADDIDLTGGGNGELQDIINRHVDRATAHVMEISTEKSKIMTNSTNNISADVSMNGQTRGGDQFQVPGSNPVQGWHLLSRSPHRNCLSNGRNTRLSRVWRCNTISFASKFKLYKSLVASILLCGS